MLLLLLPLLRLLLLVLLAWQLHCRCAAGRLGPPGSHTHEQAVDADVLALAVFAAHAAVRQHILCAAERRLTVTPFGAC